jgi:hypothetical protein
MKYLLGEKGYQRSSLAKEMPRDHGPEVTSEVAELDLALWLKVLAGSEG